MADERRGAAAGGSGAAPQPSGEGATGEIFGDDLFFLGCVCDSIMAEQTFGGSPVDGRGAGVPQRVRKRTREADVGTSGGVSGGSLGQGVASGYSAGPQGAVKRVTRASVRASTGVSQELSIKDIVEKQMREIQALAREILLSGAGQVAGGQRGVASGSPGAGQVAGGQRGVASGSSGAGQVAGGQRGVASGSSGVGQVAGGQGGVSSGSSGAGQVAGEQRGVANGSSGAREVLPVQDVSPSAVSLLLSEQDVANGSSSAVVSNVVEAAGSGSRVGRRSPSYAWSPSRSRSRSPTPIRSGSGSGGNAEGVVVVNSSDGEEEDGGNASDASEEDCERDTECCECTSSFLERVCELWEGDVDQALFDSITQLIGDCQGKDRILLKCTKLLFKKIQTPERLAVEGLDCTTAVKKLFYTVIRPSDQRPDVTAISSDYVNFFVDVYNTTGFKAPSPSVGGDYLLHLAEFFVDVFVQLPFEEIPPYAAAAFHAILEVCDGRFVKLLFGADSRTENPFVSKVIDFMVYVLRTVSLDSSNEVPIQLREDECLYHAASLIDVLFSMWKRG
eukprot:764320-Hanusia_phi.AAC.2